MTPNPASTSVGSGLASSSSTSSPVTSFNPENSKPSQSLIGKFKSNSNQQNLPTVIPSSSTSTGKPPASSKNLLPPKPPTNTSTKKLSALDKLPFGFTPIQNFTGFIRSRSTTPTRSIRSRSTTPMIDESDIRAYQKLGYNRFSNQKSLDDISDTESVKSEVPTRRKNSIEEEKEIRKYANMNGTTTITPLQQKISPPKQILSKSLVNGDVKEKSPTKLSSMKPLQNGDVKGEVKEKSPTKHLLRRSIPNGDTSQNKLEPKEKSPTKISKIDSAEDQSALATKTKIKSEKLPTKSEKRTLSSLKLKVPSSIKKAQQIEECVTSPVDCECSDTIPIISQPETPQPNVSINQTTVTQKLTSTATKSMLPTAASSDIEPLSKPVNTTALAKTTPNEIGSTTKTEKSQQIESSTKTSSKSQLSSSLKTSTTIPSNEAHVQVKKKSKLTANIQITDSPGFKLSKLPSTSDILAAVSSKLKDSSITCDKNSNSNNSTSNNSCFEPATPIIDLVEITTPTKDKDKENSTSSSSTNILSMVDSKINYITENQKTVTTNTTIDDTLSSSKLSITEGFQLYKLSSTSDDILAAVDSTIESSSSINNKYIANGLNESINTNAVDSKILPSMGGGLSRGFKLSKKSSSSNLHALLQMSAADEDDDDDGYTPPQQQQNKPIPKKDKKLLETVAEDELFSHNNTKNITEETPDASGGEKLKSIKIKNISTSSNEQSETIVKKETGKIKKKKIIKKVSAELTAPGDDPNGELQITKLAKTSDIQKEIIKDPTVLSSKITETCTDALKTSSENITKPISQLEAEVAKDSAIISKANEPSDRITNLVSKKNFITKTSTEFATSESKMNSEVKITKSTSEVLPEVIKEATGPSIDVPNKTDTLTTPIVKKKIIKKVSSEGSTPENRNTEEKITKTVLDSKADATQDSALIAPNVCDNNNTQAVVKKKVVKKISADGTKQVKELIAENSKPATALKLQAEMNKTSATNETLETSIINKKVINAISIEPTIPENQTTSKQNKLTSNLSNPNETIKGTAPASASTNLNKDSPTETEMKNKVTKKDSSDILTSEKQLNSDSKKINSASDVQQELIKEATINSLATTLSSATPAELAPKKKIIKKISADLSSLHNQTNNENLQLKTSSDIQKDSLVKHETAYTNSTLNNDTSTPLVLNKKVTKKSETDFATTKDLYTKLAIGLDTVAMAEPVSPTASLSSDLSTESAPKKKKIIKKRLTDSVIQNQSNTEYTKLTSTSDTTTVNKETEPVSPTTTLSSDISTSSAPKKKIVKVKKLSKTSTEQREKPVTVETKIEEFSKSIKSENDFKTSPISDSDFIQTLLKNSDINNNSKFERSFSMDRSDYRSSVPPEFGSSLRKLPSSSDILAAVEEKFESNYLNNRESRASSVVGMPATMRAKSQSPAPIDGCIARSSSAADIVRRVRAQSVLNSTNPLLSIVPQPVLTPGLTATNISPMVPPSTAAAIGLNPLGKLPSSSDILAAVESKFETSYLHNRPTNILTKTPSSPSATGTVKKTKKKRPEATPIEIPETPAPILNTELLAKAAVINNLAKVSNGPVDISMIRSPSPLSFVGNLSTTNNFPAPLGKPPPKLPPSVSSNRSSVNRPFSRSMSLTTDRCSRSITPRRVFPQTYSRENSSNLEGISEMEQSPVIFDANLQFVMGCNQQPLYQSVHATPSHKAGRTASRRLSEEIQNFLKKTDHVMEEWKQIGKRQSVCGTEDTVSLIERQRVRHRSLEPGDLDLGRSKSAQNILMKGFQMTNRLPSMSMSRGNSVSRSISCLQEEDDDSDAQTLKDIDEVNKYNDMMVNIRFQFSYILL